MDETPPTTPTTPPPGEAPKVEDVAAAQAEAAQKAEEEKAAAEKAAAEKAGSEGSGKEEEGGKEEPRTFTADDIKIPDGLDVDEGLRDGFVELANKHQLSPEVVGDLVDLQASAMKEASEKGSQLWTDTQKKWQDEAAADADIGGEKLDPLLGNISKMIEWLGGDRTDNIRKAFDFTGFGNHPDAIFFLDKVIGAIGEAKLLAGKAGSSDRSAAETMFPNQGT